MKIQKNIRRNKQNASKVSVGAARGGRDEAIEYIRSAIHTLGTDTKDDIIAKEAIANLSVVLLDLKG